MKNGKYCNGKKGLNMKPLAILLALTLLAGCAIGGTLAWLTAKTDPVQNTFTTSDINITLTESDNLDLKMIPGHTITKDPKATVVADSEACYLFVEITESENFDVFMTYAIADGWTQGTGEGDGKDGVPTNVIYRTVASAANDQTFGILADNKVTVNSTVTKQDMNGLTQNTYPSLTFKAYAVQLYKDNNTQFTAAEAWSNHPTT